MKRKLDLRGIFSKTKTSTFLLFAAGAPSHLPYSSHRGDTPTAKKSMKQGEGKTKVGDRFVGQVRLVEVAESHLWGPFPCLVHRASLLLSSLLYLLCLSLSISLLSLSLSQI